MPSTDLAYTYTWDGKDAYGRILDGLYDATIKVGYVYQAAYLEPSELQKSFGRFTQSGNELERNDARTNITTWTTREAALGKANNPSGFAPAWSISEHHYYDFKKNILFRGNGPQKSYKELVTIRELTKALYPYGVAHAPDGRIFVAEYQGGRITTIDPDGSTSYMSASQPSDVAVSPSGEIYYANYYSIEKYDFSGNQIHIAGYIPPPGYTRREGYNGDEIPASNARVYGVQSLAFDSKGRLYFADGRNNRIRMIDKEGIIHTVAGGSDNYYEPQDVTGKIATDVRVYSPNSVSVSNSDEVYFSSSSSVYRLNIDGTLTHIAGTYSWQADEYKKGGDAANTDFTRIVSTTFDKNGVLYIAAELDNGRGFVIFSVNDGKIVPLAGKGVEKPIDEKEIIAENAKLSYVYDMEFDSNGRLLMVTPWNDNVLQLSFPYILLPNGNYGVPSESGGLLHEFSPEGTHLSTINALTGEKLRSFEYDDLGELNKIVEGNNVVKIEWNNGHPTSIIGKDGQVTNIVTNSEGTISELRHPDGSSHQFTYTTDGLMLSMTDQRNNTSTFEYNEAGQLVLDKNVEGGFWALEREDSSSGYRVVTTSAEGRSKTHIIESLDNGDKRRAKINTDGTISETIKHKDGSVDTVSPDGTLSTVQYAPERRFGLFSPIPAQSFVKTPGGLTSESTFDRLTVLVDPNDILSVSKETTTTSTNGRIYTSVFDAESLTITNKSAENRETVSSIDLQGRLLTHTLSGFETLAYTYDDKGRLVETDQAGRITSYTYNSDGYVDSITNPLGETTTYSTDIMGRVLAQSFPDGRTIKYGYDDNGNLTSLTPPGRDAHLFSYDGINQETEYSPPSIAAGNSFTRYVYNRDRDLTQIARPDGLSLNFTYDDAGRLVTLNAPRDDINYFYESKTGQLSRIENSDMTLGYTYDGFLQTQETLSGAIAGSITRHFDNNFWVTGLSVNADRVNYAYDNDGLLTQAGDLVLDRDLSSGLLLGTVLGSVSTDQTYNGFAELAGFTAKVGGSAVYDTLFVRDALGRIVEKTEMINGSVNHYYYDYDLSGRLVNVTKDNLSIAQYGYDDNGNRVSGFNGAGNIAAQYDAQDRLTRYGSANYEYTLNGELLAKRMGTSVTQYDYDVLGNVRSVVLSDGTKVDYIIDGKNRRVGKKVNGDLVQGFLYQDQLNPVAELDGNGNVVARFVYGAKPNIPDYMVKNGNTYRIISDHLGSPLLVIDVQTNAIAQQMEYDEFGNVLFDTHPGFQPFGFAGGIYDQHTKLTRFGARDYDAEIGRWTSKDPIRFEGGDTNLYGYVSTDPINFVDSTGLCKDYWDRYADHLNNYLIDVGPYASALAGGLWPKSLAPATRGRPPLLGSSNPLTSVPRAVGMPGAGSVLVRTGAAGIGVATVGIGFYNIGVFASGLVYAAFPGSNGLPASGN